MKNLKTIAMMIGLSGAFALSACGGPLDDAKKFADEMCACKDAECVKKVSDKAEKKLGDEAMEKLAKENPEEMAKLLSRIMECSMKHMDMPKMPTPE